MQELKNEFETDYDVDDSNDEKWKMKAHGQEIIVPAGKEDTSKVTIKVGTTNIIEVSDLSTLYGQITDYTSVEGLQWQLFYSDINNIYLIASDYVPNANLPCNENTINGVTYGATDLVKSTSTRNLNSTYCACFCSSSSYNDGVLTEGTIYKNGSSSTTIRGNPLSSVYLQWATTYSSSTDNNICAVAYIMDTSKWSSFVGNATGAYAIGGPTIEMLSLSWNAVTGHTQMTSYATLSESNSTSRGYKANYPENDNGFFGSSTNMWFIKDKSKASGYWLAAPASNGVNLLRYVACNGLVSNYYAYSGEVGFRPVVSIPKTSLK